MLKYVLITPCKNYLLAELCEKASSNLNKIINQTKQLKWKKTKDVNGKDREQFYIVADTTLDKEYRLTQFAKILCEDEKYKPHSRICLHDLYYEDYEKYFSPYSE